MPMSSKSENFEEVSHLIVAT